MSTNKYDGLRSVATILLTVLTAGLITRVDLFDWLFWPNRYRWLKRLQNRREEVLARLRRARLSKLGECAVSVGEHTLRLNRNWEKELSNPSYYLAVWDDKGAGSWIDDAELIALFGYSKKLYGSPSFRQQMRSLIDYLVSEAHLHVRHDLQAYASPPKLEEGWVRLRFETAMHEMSRHERRMGLRHSLVASPASTAEVAPA